MLLVIQLLRKLLPIVKKLLLGIAEGTGTGLAVDALTSLFDDPNQVFRTMTEKLEEIRKILVEKLGKPQNGETTSSNQTMGQSMASATAPLGEALSLLQKKLEEGLCPAVEGLTEKLVKVPDPGLMLGALHQSGGDGAGLKGYSLSGAVLRR